MIKKNISLILIFVSFSLFVLLPSFSLALTGDDYLGLWRFNQALNGKTDFFKQSFIYFLNDYGPQDILTAVIHHFFGFKPIYYYSLAFVLRILAAISIFLTVYSITKNRLISFFSGIFFVVCTTGLETTDWSFNMPSYIAIIFFNIFYYFILKNDIKSYLYSTIFFVITITVQPIRFIFLPVFLISLQITSLFFNSLRRISIRTFPKLIILLLAFVILFKFSNFGGMVGGRGVGSISQNYGSVISAFREKNFSVLLSPIRQIGVIFISESLLNPGRIFFSFTIVSVFFNLLFLKILDISSNKIFLSCLANFSWILFVKYFFADNSSYPLQYYEIFQYLLGGFIIILSFFIIFSNNTNSRIKFGFLSGCLLLSTAFIIPWLRNPGFVYENTGRYLIVSSVGLTLWLACFFQQIYEKTKIISLLGFLLFISLHAKSSYEYLNKLRTYRDSNTTQKLQSQIPNIPEFHNGSYSLFYFEGDPAMLHHVFLFGFPVVMSFQHEFTDFSKIAYTNDWSEVVSAVKDGESMKRFFGGKPVKINLSNVYAYKVSGDYLEDTTSEKRLKLK